MRYKLASALVLGGLCAAQSIAGQATFTMLTVQDAADVTIDEFGRTLVLALDGGAVFIYDSGSYSFVGDGSAFSMSGDGASVAGSIFNIDGFQEAARGTVGGGWQMLGGLNTCDFFLSSGWGISGDGSTVVGLAWPSCNSSGFVWTAETGLLDLENLGNGTNRATVVSDDGQVIGGFAQGSFSRTPAVWDASDQSGWLFDIDAQGEVGAINSDGSMVAGEYYDDTLPGFYLFPFTWTENGGLVFYPYLPEYPGGNILGVSEDGRTLVGISGTILGGRVAMVWRPEWGTVELKAKLIELGAAVPNNYFPQVARGVTDDGQTVVGWGILFPENPKEQAQLRGFVATLPPAIEPVCPEDLDGDGQVGFTDLTQLLGTWGPCASCPEDLDGDGQVGFTDLTQLLGTWGPCA